MKTIAQRILDLLMSMDRPASRAELAQKLGVSPQYICNPITRLKKYGEINEIPRGFGTVTMFEVKHKEINSHVELLRRIAVATRYKTSGQSFISATYADEARASLK